MKNNLLIAFITCCTALSLHAEVTPSILPLGDSITQADLHHASYRRALAAALTEAGWAFDFVGSTQGNHGGNNPQADFDLDHEGHWGWRIDEINAQLPTWLKNYTPDIALIHLGTNDLFQQEPVEQVLGELEACITLLRADNPNITLYLAQLIPANRAQKAIHSFNEQLPAFAEKIQQPNSQVIVVDHFSQFDVTKHTYDGIHPNEAGEKRMASAWMAALKKNNKRDHSHQKQN